MRTLSKDILMICKMWYDKDNNTSVVNALSKYIETYTWCEPDTDTLNHFLGHAIKKFIDTNTLVNMLKEHSESMTHRNELPKIFILQTYISLLQLKEVSDIDLTEYDKIESYVQNPVVKNKDWWEYFADPVEDDRD